MQKIILTFFLMISLNVFAQEKWSLEKCINYALENNIQIKQQELNTKISEVKLNQKKATILPSLNAGANQNFTFGRSVDPFTNQFSTSNTKSNNFSLQSSLTLFNGFQNINNLKKAKLDLKASLENLQKLKNDISLNIASAYLNILFNNEILKTAKQQAEITKLQVERTKKLVNAGNLSQDNLLTIESQLASEELQIVKAENQYKMSILTLQQFLDLDTLKDFKIVIPENIKITENNDTPDEIYQTAIKNLPQIRAAEYNLQSSQQSLQISKGMLSPRLVLNGSYGTGYSDQRQIPTGPPIISSYISGYTESLENVYSYKMNYDYTTKPFNDQIKDNANFSLSFSLSIPIFNGFQTKSNIDNSKINVLNNQYNLKLAKNQLYKDIQQQYFDVKAAIKKYYAAKKAVDANKLSFNLKQEKFNVGLINSVDYNIAKNNLFKAKSDFLQAKYEYLFKSKILDFYKGKNIKL